MEERNSSWFLQIICPDKRHSNALCFRGSNLIKARKSCVICKRFCEWNSTAFVAWEMKTFCTCRRSIFCPLNYTWLHICRVSSAMIKLLEKTWDTGRLTMDPKFGSIYLSSWNYLSSALFETYSQKDKKKLHILISQNDSHVLLSPLFL